MLDLKKTTGSKFTTNFLGLIDYEKGLAFQQYLQSKVKGTDKIEIIGCEHPEVITLGYRAKPEDEVLVTTSDIKIVKINRGGLATLHSPGQLLIYPILDLKEQRLGVREFVKLLLHTTSKTLRDFGVQVVIDETNTGVYTAIGKVAFCGVQVTNYCTLHGLSINISNDLSLFTKINSCGLRNPKLDKLNFYNSGTTTEKFYALWCRNFIENLNF